MKGLAAMQEQCFVFLEFVVAYCQSRIHTRPEASGNLVLKTVFLSFNFRAHDPSKLNLKIKGDFCLIYVTADEILEKKKQNRSGPGMTQESTCCTHSEFLG